MGPTRLPQTLRLARPQPPRGANWKQLPKIRALLRPAVPLPHLRLPLGRPRWRYRTPRRSIRTTVGQTRSLSTTPALSALPRPTQLISIGSRLSSTPSRTLAAPPTPRRFLQARILRARNTTFRRRAPLLFPPPTALPITFVPARQPTAGRITARGQRRTIPSGLLPIPAQPETRTGSRPRMSSLIRERFQARKQLARTRWSWEGARRLPRQALTPAGPRRPEPTHPLDRKGGREGKR